MVAQTPWRWMRRQLARLRPRQRGQLGHYKAEFPETARAFQRFLKRCRVPARPANGLPVAVAVMPWVGTPMPWYCTSLALALAGRGRAVTLIWDDTPFPARSPFWELQNQLIGEVLAGLAGPLDVVRLSQMPAAPAQPGDDQHLRRLADLNLAWELRGRLPTLGDQRYSETAGECLQHTLARLRSLYARRRFAYTVTPGGIYGSSGLILLAGREAGCRVSTFGAGLGWVQSCNDGIAAQQTDIPAAFAALAAGDAASWQPLLEAARHEFEQRRQGRDRARFQAVQAAEAPGSQAGDVLLPLNVDFDAAALGRHLHFANTAEWITETVACILEHSSATVVVRQHPSERRPEERSRFDVGALLRDRFGAEPRLRFVAAADPVSSYDLLRQARVVLPYVSTIGIEAAALGKTVLMAGAAYYNRLGFVHAAGSRAEYFVLLARALRGELPALPHQAERAWLCYYLTQVCNRVWTRFTPQPIDFWQWQRRNPAAVFTEPGVADLLTAIDENVPLALIRHRRRAQTGA